MADDFHSKGICSGCIHHGHCSLRKDDIRPVWHCEEYDSGPAAPPATLPAQGAVAQAIEEELGLVGLCVNCENRHHCTYPRPAGGVWHCAEYR